MTAEQFDLIYPILQQIQRDVSGLNRRMDDVTQRLQALERSNIEIQKALVTLSDENVQMRHRMDDFDRRLTRIERRLDLLDPALQD